MAYYQTFYVTFGDLLIDYHLIVTAKDAEIVAAYMVRRARIGCWSRIVTEQPATKPLNAKPLELCYQSADHI